MSTININTKRMSFKLKYIYINFIFKIIDIPLHGEERKERDHFMRFLLTKMDELERDRLAIVRDLAEKDEKGEPKIKPDKNYDLTPENLSKFHEEYTKILESDFIVDILDSNKKQIKVIRNILDNTNAPLNFTDSKLLEEIINCFDTQQEIKEEEVKKEETEEKNVENEDNKE
ncbi:MAG: hypothetical protein WC438_05565 [Candidatus Pacearchaeota archaeon]